MPPKSSGIGEYNNIQCFPPSVVRSSVPDLPITQQTLSEVAEPAVRSAVTPLCCGLQVLPRSLLRSILPASPRRQACFSPGATMRRRLVVAWCTRSAVYPALTDATCAEATFCAGAAAVTSVLSAKVFDCASLFFSSADVLGVDVAGAGGRAGGGAAASMERAFAA